MAATGLTNQKKEYDRQLYKKNLSIEELLGVYEPGCS
jgi:hypothetical protein